MSIYYLLFGAILGSAFNIFEGIEMSSASTVLALIGLIGLNQLPKTYKGFYLFGIAFHTVSLFWVGQSLNFAKYTIGVDLSFFVPFVSFAISLILALQFPIALRVGGRKYWIIPFMLLDLVRSFSSLLFPWNFIGYTATLWLSSLRFVGVIGMSAYTLLLSQIKDFPKKIQFGFLGLSCVLIVDHYFYQRIEFQRSPYTVKIVQTNFSRDTKILEDHTDEIMELSLKGDRVAFIVWPESSVLNCLYSYPELRGKISQIIPEGTQLLLGHLRIETGLHVCVSALDHIGDIVSTYDKQYLVPFGEYTPLSWIPRLSHGTRSCEPGIFKNVLNTIPKAAPLICYETAFPYLLKSYRDAKWIVAVSNDAWFGISNGPYQHFHLARCRAIEEKKPFVRSVNAGVSGLIAPNGRVLAHIPFRETGVVDTFLVF
ncbi:MAG: apolipoprotein N-acyltransferase [Alphaproteobacteria bacterium]|nr:MAG: apolipoprotein N-acyltransferase [Alphaproteobacteria bacterium]